MKIVGIVCEYNPFHNGHLRQLRHVADKGISVCLMSGNYVQRGEPAIIDKSLRAQAAVRCGADVVLELPVTVAVQSAEGFAGGAVEIFHRLGADALCFGSESGDGAALMDTAEALLHPEFPDALHRELDRGLSFPAARQRALGERGRLLEKPNDILAVEYCKAILRAGGRMEPMVLQRQGDYHGGSDPENPSASFLRGRADWAGFVPPQALEIFHGAPRHTMAAGERAVLGRLRMMGEEDFARLPYGSEGLWRKLMYAVRSQGNMAEMIAATKSRRYTHSRICRMILCAALGLSAEDLTREIPYIRVLGLSERGRAALRWMKDHGDMPLLHAGTASSEPEYGEIERRTGDFYGLFAENSPEKPGAEDRRRLFRNW